MANVLRFVEDDLTTVRLDLQSLVSTPTAGFNVIHDVDLGGEESEAEWLYSSLEPGAAQSEPSRPQILSHLRLYAKHTAYDELVALIRLIANELDRYNILEWRPDGAAVSTYMDTFPSPIAGMFRGQDLAMQKIVKQFHDPDGFPVPFYRQPWFRGATEAGTPTAMTNASGGRDILLSNPGNRDGIAKLTFDPDSGSIGEVLGGIKSTGNLTEFIAKYNTKGTVTTYNGSSSGTVGDTTDAVSTDFDAVAPALGETMGKRFRDVRTFTDPTAIEGVYRVRVRYTETGGTTSGRYRIRLGSGFNTGVATEMEPRIKVDWRDVSSATFVEETLGFVRVPPGVTTLTMEVHAERLSGDRDLAFDPNLILVPASEQTIHWSVPGWRMGRPGRRHWDAEQLELSGATFKDDKAKLNTNGEYVRTKPATENLVAGIYELSCEVTVQDDPDNGGEVAVGQLKVMKNGSLAQSRNLRSHRNKWKKDYLGRKRVKLRFEVTASDETTPSTYNFRVEFTGSTEDGRKMFVHEMHLAYVAAISSASPAVIDGLSRVSYAGAGSIPSFNIVNELGFLKVPPGDSVLILCAGDLPTGVAYESISSDPSPLSVLARAWELTVDITPRWSHA